MGGMSVKVTSATYHIAESTVQVWKRMWMEANTDEPEKAIQEGQRGRRMGACRTLTPEQEEKLQAEIVGKTSEQSQYEFALWSAKAVKLHILKRFGIDMPDRTVRFYLKRWGGDGRENCNSAIKERLSPLGRHKGHRTVFYPQQVSAGYYRFLSHNRNSSPTYARANPFPSSYPIRRHYQLSR